MLDIDLIIKTGDRADLKRWLAESSEEALLANWIKLSCCGVQDFSELTQNEMLRRGIFRRA